MEGGGIYDQFMVSVFDRVLDKVLKPRIGSDSSIKMELLACINAALGAGTEDKDLLKEINKIPYAQTVRTGGGSTGGSEGSLSH